MPLLVTSAACANGDAYGVLIAFDLSGRLLGGFSEDARIAARRGLAVDWDAPLLFLNSGENRGVALDPHGKVVRDTSPMPSRPPTSTRRCCRPDAAAVGANAP